MPQNQNYLGSPQTDVREWVGAVPAPVRTSMEDFATATHAATTITIPAPAPGFSNVLGGVAWSYSGGTPVGSITIADGTGNTVFSQDFSGIGNGVVYFNPPRAFSPGVATIITLADGSASVVGKVNALGRYTTPLTPLIPYTSGGSDFSLSGNTQYIPVLAL